MTQRPTRKGLAVERRGPICARRVRAARVPKNATYGWTNGPRVVYLKNVREFSIKLHEGPKQEYHLPLLVGIYLCRFFYRQSFVFSTMEIRCIIPN